MEKHIKTIGILTSGGDSPGMNAAIRAVTRTARFNNINVIGIQRGYQGLIDKEFLKFTSSSVSNTIQRGGTILKTARSKEFMTPKGRKIAHENMVEAGIDALIVIGGNGSLTGAQQFAKEFDIPIIGLPGTIDNDLYGTDATIGYDSALNTIVECVDKIRDTANSHDRIFFIEVMGRDAGFLAQNSAIASGAEAAIIPESATDVDQLADFIERGKRKSKNSAIVLVSEAQKDGVGGAFYYAERAPATGRHTVGLRPDPCVPDGLRRHRGPARGPAEHHDRHQERRDRVRAHLPCREDEQAHQPGAHHRAQRAVHVIPMIYRIILSLRHFLFDKGWKKSYKADVPTICVGNITVGGTGKTPHTEMILRMLLRSDDWAYSDIAVLSRGYKRKTKGFQKVGRDGTALLYGDEPLQIAKKFPAVTVAVDKDRVEGCRFLTHPEELQTAKKAKNCLDQTVPEADLIVLDDAFQYRRLKADVNIVLVDYNRPVQKDKLMPWGRLRDLPSRLKAADILIVTKCPSYLDEWEKGKWAKQLGVENYNTASCTGVRKLRKGKEKQQTVLFTTIGYEPMVPVFPEEADSRFMYAQRLILFTGIAKDMPLRAYLSDKYKEVKRFSFPDHHKYTNGDIAKVAHAVREYPTACVATTEKDAQRIVDTKKVPETLRKRLFQVPINIQFLSPAEKEIFETTLLDLLRGLRSES